MRIIMSGKLDILLFGATGFTGKFTIPQLHKLVKNLSWGIAGRNEQKLRNVLTEVAQQIGVKDDFNNIPVILADVEDEESIKKMTARAKVIINCCGPFDIFGEVVVKSCIETGTHYVDVTGEIQFIMRMFEMYGDAAEKKGVYIISACGFDSIPTDLGICFLENNFSGTINSAETYMDLYVEGLKRKSVGNYGTWATTVNSLGSMHKMFLFKKNFDRVQRPSFKPKLGVKLLTRLNDRWACLMPTADVDVVYHSQQYFYEHDNKRPIQMQNYLLLYSFMSVILFGIFVLMIAVLGQFKFGRNLLLKYPEFFTNGAMTHQQPSEDVTNRSRFKVTIKCRGWNDKLLTVKDQYKTLPNKEIIGRVSGVNPGYGFTPLASTLAAVIILTETGNLPSKPGIYTPAAAFSKTTLIQQLQDNGVVFEVLSIKDI